MRFKRRGFRQGTFLKPRRMVCLPEKEITKTPPISWEEFYEELTPLLRPGWEGEIKNFSELYQQMKQEDQKKLTHKIAGQILFAHSDIVGNVFKRLSNISLDLSQQTEVAYRRLKLIDKFF